MATFGTPDDPDPNAPRPEIKLPRGYDGEEAFLDEMREIFVDNESFDYFNHEAGSEDLSFLVGNQWDPDAAQRRTNKRKPVLTINRLPAFAAQVIGARRMHETQIKVVPDNGGTKQVAQVREGLVRNIQKVSRAKFAYDTAFLHTVSCGIGNWEILIDYENDDVWDQKIGVHALLDPFAVVWDKFLKDPTGKDAGNCFVVDVMSEKEYRRRWPWATPSDIMQQRFRNERFIAPWFVNDNVRIVKYWRMRTRKRVLALMRNGATVDITDKPVGTLGQVAVRPDGSPYIREVQKPYAQRYLCSGTDILEGPYELPIDRIPVFRVPGWEVTIGEQTFRWGLIRHMKDPQRLHNFWRSAIAEKIQQSPRATFMASDTAVQGREADWRSANETDDSLLIYNGEAGDKPERLAPIQIEGALIEQAEVTTQDLKDVSNIHEANLGMPSNEVSGAAINARVRVSDTGTAIYQDNLSDAIEESGRVLNLLIPVVYDSPRVIKVLGEDSKELMQAINMDGNPGSVDITLGRYSVTAVTGPSFATKRQEQAENMMGIAQAMPQTFAVCADLIVESQDWAGADKIAARLRRSMPPQLLGPDEQTPESQAAMQGQQQAQAEAAQAAQQKAMADFLKTQSEAALNMARAQNYNAEAQTRPGQLQNESLRTASEAASRELRDHLAVIDTATH